MAHTGRPRPPPRFASPRERRLWTWTIAAVGGIYSTLALASVLPAVLYDQNVAAAAFLGAMFLVGTTVLTQGLRIRPGGLEVGIALGLAAVYAMVFFRMAMPERSHLVEYGVVAVLMYEALVERRSSGRSVPLPWLIAIVGTGAVGAVDEAIQIVLPHRVFDPVDILFNFLAGVAVVPAMVLLGWIRSRTAAARGSPDGVAGS